jgi:flagella basal body P-ring formation protein FlgA
MKGWVSESQVKQWLSSIQFDDKPIEMNGFKRVWIEWCYPADLNASLAEAKRQIQDLLTDKVQLVNIETDSNQKACFDQGTTKLEWLSFEKVRGTRYAGKLQFQFEQAKSIERTFYFEVDATVDAIALKSKGRRQQPLSQLKVKAKRVSWSGDELLDRETMSGYQLKKTLPRNTVLKISHFNAVDDVPKGQVVKVKVNYGAIVINTKGTAITAGNVGQRIKVRVDGSNEMSEGQIIEKGVVHVSV